jgi:DNA primase catalytic core
MARIPEQEIERLKSEISVERLVEASGVALKRAGKDLLGRCPFHEDAEASLVVTPAKNLWHCFGCQIGGGPIDWVMKSQGVSFRHAVELLRNDSPLAATVVKVGTVRKLPAPVAYDADDAALLAQVVGYYHETLKASPEALDYLKARGLDHPELIDRFKLGFANRTLGLRLPQANRAAGAEIRGRLQKLGVLRESGHEHFNGSLVVPVYDEQGAVSEIYGRKVTPNLRAGTPLHLYLPGPHRGVWNREALAASKEVILCEALIDAMTFWCAGFRNVTSSYGVEGFTDDILAAFKAHGTERVLIAYDRDAAGDKAAGKLAERLMGEGIECWRVQFPHGMDANEYALKVTPANRSLGVAIRKSAWLGKGEAPGRDVDQEPIMAAHTDPAVEVVLMEATASPLAAELAAKEETASLPLPASPVAPAPSETPAEVRENEVVMALGDRRWRVRGLAKNLAYDVLKVNVLVARGERLHVDTLDLYSAKARASYVTQAAIELELTEEIVKADLGRVFLKLEALQDEAIRKVLEPQPVAVTIAEPDHAEAMALLKSTDLLERILADFEACGIVGEATNKLTAYIAAVSRKLERPLAVVVQSSSAAGKTSLMEAVLAFVPEEERAKYSAMTGQSLFYMGETNLKHKVLAIVEEEGASRATYALKLLQSEGELTIASTAKDPQTGNLTTQEYRVEGPVMIFLTTTAIEVDEELLNRCLVLSVDEGRTQTEAIHRLQRARRTLEGLFGRRERDHLVRLHQNAQRLLKPLAVVNPFAKDLTFLSDKTRTRRDHEKYLTLIDAIALLHQHQRPVKTASWRGEAIEYVEATREDIALANRLAHEVLGRSLDELPPQTRRLLGEVVALVDARASAQAIARSEVRFSRKDVRDATGWSDTQLRVHLSRLTELEYVLVHRGARGQSFEYELLYDGDGALEPHLSGLIDVTTIASSRGATPPNAGSTRPSSGAIAGGSPQSDAPLELPRKRTSGGNGAVTSYPHAEVVEPLPLAAAHG